MAITLVLHALKVVPFAPLVTTLQKIVILSFAAWLLFLSAKNAGYAAAARVCSDPETAERPESAVDSKYLKREGGLLWLDVNREWRIGATAMRIISLAESRGSRFREMKKVD